MMCPRASSYCDSSVGNTQSDSEGKADNVEVTLSVIVITQFV
jgi:hypothetical protein